MTEKQSQPVLDTARITALVHTAVVVLTLLGFNEKAHALSGETAALVSVGAGLFTLGAHYLPALFVRDKVTPVATPKAADGTTLVKAYAPEAFAPLMSSPIVGTVEQTLPIAPTLANYASTGETTNAEPTEAKHAADEPDVETDPEPVVVEDPDPDFE